MILALDNATRLGWCHGVIGALPVFGHHDFGRNRSNGEVLDDFLIWLNAKIDAVQPTMVVFESPYMPTGPQNPFAAPANALTIRRLFCFAGFTEAVCRRRRIKVYEARPSEITRAFLGGPAPKRREEKKAATVKMARLLGYDVADDDEADAVALWMYAEAQFAPAMLSRRRAGVGIELDLHGVNPGTGKKRSAPRAPRSASRKPSAEGVQTNGSTPQQDIAATGQLQLSTG